MAKYINPYTDFGFKKLFGEEGNKNLLKDFLNQLLPAHHQIEDLTFQNVEQVPDTKEERKAFTTDKQQREDYEKSRLSYLGFKQATETAENDGLKKGEQKKEIEAILGMEKVGIPIEKIAEALSVTVEYVNTILNNMKK